MSSATTPLARAETTQILVAGAGPVGLFAGLCAARRGLDVTLVEQNFRGYSHGYASVLHPSSLRLFAELGLSEDLLSAGHIVDHIDLHLDGASAHRLEFSLPALTVAQTVLEEVLLKALRAEGVEIKLPCQVTTVEHGKDGVQVRVLRRELATGGSPEQDTEWQPVESSVIHADFVIGADGYESRMREALGVEVVNAGATETFAMFEAPDTGAGAALAFSSALGSAVFPLAKQRARYGFQLASHFDESPGIGELRSLLSERMSWRGSPPEALDWGIITHFERRLARRFGRGRIWLAGDAAHITSPLGGQSMNGGLLEAHDLVEQMAHCIAGSRPLEALEQVGTAREREWHKLLGFNVSFDTQPYAPAWLLKHARRIVPALPASGNDLQYLLQQIGLVIR